MVVLKPRPIEQKIVFDIANGFHEAKSATPIPTIVLAESTTYLVE